MPHIYCIECGLVKNSSSDKPRNIAYYIRLVEALGRDIKITKVQMRLIARELESSSICDAYSMDKHIQEVIFIEVVKKYLNVKEQLLQRLIHLPI